MSLHVINPTFAGTAETIAIGSRSFGLPPGCRVQHVETPTGELAWVLDGTELHVLTSKGEVTGIPADLLDLAQAQYFPAT
mgnify:CR=1 FL=1